jgi:hypothetical protein
MVHIVEQFHEMSRRDTPGDVFPGYMIKMLMVIFGYMKNAGDDVGLID